MSTSSDRWRPPLPSLGRMGGAPVEMPRGISLLDKLKKYYTDRRSVSDMFEQRVPSAFMHDALGYRTEPRFLSEFTSDEQVHLLLKSLYFRASDNIVLKLKLELRKRNGLNRVRQWFHTANGAVLPLLISQGEDLKGIDHLTRWALENCANNYALFQKRFKLLKKALRKGWALNRSPPVPPDMRTYAGYFYRKVEFGGPQEAGRYVLLWTQTRATGMADRKMVLQSIDKFVDTVTTPVESVHLDEDTLNQTVLGALGVDGRHARISVGTTACLEATRQQGGKSTYMASLARKPCIHVEHDMDTLEPRKLEHPRPVRSAQDVLQWAVQTALEKPTFIRCIRVHAVSEPGKARTITVAPYAYQVIMGVFAHVFQATLLGRGVRSGLTRDRHLWRFLGDNLNPQSTLWGELTPGERVYGLSSDLSEATDYGNPTVSRQVWEALIRLASSRPGFPRALAVLAKTLYCSRRHIFVPVHGDCYKLVTSTRGWFMGDMMTKVILTIVHDYTMRIVGIQVYSLVGDDEVALSNSPERLRAHLRALVAVGLKVSVEDTFISSTLLFYCEEGSLVPQRPTDALHVSMRRGAELSYLDYPRIRLLLAETSETDNYSMTNIGRFSLLGKESRWVFNVNRPAYPHFAIAGLLQHILVPQDPDTLCPYTPIEIGGDGAYLCDALFLRRVIEKKSRDEREVYFRISQLMGHKFAYKFVRSDRLNEVVHKHHLLVPALRGMRALLPEDAVIVPKNDQHRIMLESIRVRGLESPESCFMRLSRSFHYREIFQGRPAVEPKFDVERSFSAGAADFDRPPLLSFLRTWANPGFRFATPHEFFVVKDLVGSVDPLCLQWDLKWDVNYPSSRSLFEGFLRDEVDITDAHFGDIYELIKRNRPLPDRVVKRLNLFMESDSYILSMLEPAWKPLFYLVSRDLRLASEIRRYLLSFSNEEEFETTVHVVDPSIYLIGRTPELYDRIPAPPGEVWVEDPGAMLHVDYTEFTDGFPHDEEIWDRPLKSVPHRYHTGVVYHTMVR